MDAGNWPRRYRTIWISDVHLGTKGCSAELLVDFLCRHDCNDLYLVGDIVDGWHLRTSRFWPDSHNRVINQLLRKARQGTRVTYIPGNHDEGARACPDLRVGSIVVRDHAVHTCADGRRMLVLHGDEFDAVVRHAVWLAFLGGHAYQMLLWLNDWVNRARGVFGCPYWSLSAYLKCRVKNAVQSISKFEAAVAAEARRRDVDGIICGHVHHAEIRTIGGVLYCNDGDWVESCTALVEDFDGNLEIVRWAEQAATVRPAAPAPAAVA